MRKEIIAFAFAILCSLAAQCQAGFTVSGSVSSSRSGLIGGCSVFLLNTNLSAISDDKGAFIFKNVPEGKYKMQISAVGYASLYIDVSAGLNGGAPINIVLAESMIQLDGVMVTAQKRDELEQQVPLSITAVSSRQVQQYRLWNSNELTAVVPNFYSSNPGDGRNVTSIRGITTTSYDPAVATYIDGVNQFGLDTYIPHLFDVERIEILRGPQGTFYGRNAMGGVVNIVTKRPSNKTAVFAEITAGNYDQQRYTAGFRIPVIKNKLFFGASGLYNKRKGFYTNEFNNAPFDNQSSFTGNYYLRFIASEKWSATLNVKHTNNLNDGAFPLVNGPADAIENPYRLNQNALAEMIDRTFNSSLNINYVNKQFIFTSQTAWQSNHRFYDQALDGDFSPIDGVTIFNNYGDDWNKVKVFTQELKFSSPATTGGRLKWTAGSYFFHQDNPAKQAVHFGRDAALLGAPDTAFSIISTTKGKTSGIAVFAQGTYAVTQKLDIIAGLRYDLEKKKYNVLGEYQKDPNPVPVFETQPDTSGSTTFAALSPKLGIAYSVSDNTNAFAIYSRGYRTGGLTQLSSDPSQPPLFPYKPEYSSNVEVGIKNNFFNSRLRLNGSIFFTVVSDVQVPTLVLPDAITVTKNAGKLFCKGLELEMSAIPVKGLQVDYNFGYTDATYKNLKLSQSGSEVDLDGKKQIFTPGVTSLLAAQYNYLLSEKHAIKLSVRGEWKYLGKQYFDLSNNISQGAYSLFNSQVGVSVRNFELMFWARNIGSKKYIAYAYDFGAVHLGDPKTIGVTLAMCL
ncbi:MAG: TonB-dependent receptor [Bacteroidota bacterium]